MFVVIVGARGLVAWDVLRAQPVGGCWVDEGRNEVERAESLDEEFLERSSLGAEEGAGLGVAF